MSIRGAVVACVSVLVFVAGPGCGLWWCGPEPCPSVETIVPVDRIVSEYNANASQVAQVWAKAKIEVTVPTPTGC